MHILQRTFVGGRERATLWHQPTGQNETEASSAGQTETHASMFAKGKQTNTRAYTAVRGTVEPTDNGGDRGE